MLTTFGLMIEFDFSEEVTSTIGKPEVVLSRSGHHL